jgi:hypothetical protein
MALLSDSLNVLARNVFGGNDVAVSLRKSPIEVKKDVGPTAHLNNDPFAFSSITYPRDVVQDQQNGHYMLFYINVQNKTKYIYQPAEGGAGSKIGEEVQYERRGGADTWTEFKSYGDTNASYRADLVKKGGTGNVLDSDGVSLKKGRKARTGINSVIPTTTRITDSIAIYLPPNVQDKTTAGYNNQAEMGMIGMAAVGGTELVQALMRKDYAAALKNVGGAAKDILEETAKRMGSAFLGTLSGVDPESVTGLANKAFGQATNPFMEVIFEKVGMRTFSYNFTFTPRNAGETEDVQRIIKMFRFHMMPELRGSSARYMTLPSTFDIHYMYQMTPNVAHENSFYNKIATCVLTDCDVDYTPDGVKSFQSGAPTQIKMSLSFMETEMLTKQHVDAGF